MKKTPSPRGRQLNAAKVAIITGIITAISTISVALIGILPQFREADTEKIKELQSQIDGLKQSVGGISASNPEGKGGTPTGRTADLQAPHIQVNWSQLDPAVPQDQYMSRGKEALERSGFRGIGTSTNLTYGFDREYTGMVLLTSGHVVFVVSGQDWQIADSKAQNLKRGF